MKYKILGLISLAIGIVICVCSVNYYKTEQKKHETYIPSVAVVIEYEDCELDDDQIGSRYIAEYKIDRNTYYIKSLECTNIPKAKGKEVKIKYNPDNPSEAIFANDITRYFLPFAGIAFIISAGIIFKKYC